MMHTYSPVTRFHAPVVMRNYEVAKVVHFPKINANNNHACLTWWTEFWYIIAVERISSVLSKFNYFIYFTSQILLHHSFMSGSKIWRTNRCTVNMELTSHTLIMMLTFVSWKPFKFLFGPVSVLNNQSLNYQKTHSALMSQSQRSGSQVNLEIFIFKVAAQITNHNTVNWSCRCHF